jgi:pectate lyase
MPRVRYGKVHVFNNLYTTSGNNYAIRAGFMANIVIENNTFENVGKPHEIDNNNAMVRADGNSYTGVSASSTRAEAGNAFDPASYYAYSLESPAASAAAIRANAGPQ